MLLGAVPDPIKEEIISARSCPLTKFCTSCAFRFNPVGLRNETSCCKASCGTHVGDVLDWLRMWRRHVQRAKELQVTLLDGLVLLGA